MLRYVALEALSSFETSVLTRAMQHNIPEDGIHHLLSCFLVDGFDMWVQNVQKDM
jgi:hypothetical protein